MSVMLNDQRGLYTYVLTWPKFTRYWAEILQVISDLAQTLKSLNLLVCLLGANDYEIYPKGIYTMVTRLLYLARKLIAQFLLAATVPTKAQWIAYVNSLLPIEQLAYRH